MKRDGNVVSKNFGLKVRKTKRTKKKSASGFEYYGDENDGFYEADVRVTVDLAALLRVLGPKAVLSKSQKSILQGGIVKVEVIGPRRHIPEGEQR